MIKKYDDVAIGEGTNFGVTWRMLIYRCAGGQAKRLTPSGTRDKRTQAAAMSRDSHEPYRGFCESSGCSFRMYGMVGLWRSIRFRLKVSAAVAYLAI